jgi:hypothetical protein
MAPNNPLKKLGKDLVVMFTYLMDVLRDPKSFPNSYINELMTLTWRLLGNKVINATMMGSINTIRFYVEVQGSELPLP